MATEFARISGSYSTAYIGRYDVLSQNIAGNYTTFRLYGIFYYGGGTSVGSSSSTFTLHTSTIKTGSYRYYPGETQLGYVDINIGHNNDGSFPSTYIGISANSYHMSGSAGGYLSAPSIARAPSYTSINATNVTEHTVRLTAGINTQGLLITGGGWDISTNSGSTWTYYSGSQTDKTITGLKSGTQYWYRGYVTTAGGNANSQWGTFTTKDCVVRSKINGAWKKGVPYVRVNGAWKKGVPYIKVNGAWKEGIN